MSTRDDRQKETIRKWVEAKGIGTAVCATGYGKTRIALTIIKKMSSVANFSAIVVVPTEVLRQQWKEQLQEWGIDSCTEVQIINSASKKKQRCMLLVVDECQVAPADTFVKIFDSISYRYIFGLTATYERLDGKHEILDKYCPPIDHVSLQECLVNGWVSPYKEYLVVLDVDDIDDYKKLNRQFVENFEYLGYDFNRVMKMCGQDGYKERIKLRDEICKTNNALTKDYVMKQITLHQVGFMRALQGRKKFIANHPSKLATAQKIIAARKDKKIITFCTTIKMAEQFRNGLIYTGKDSKKSGRAKMEDFSKPGANLIHTCKIAQAGVNIPDLDVAIDLSVNSSTIKSRQQLGRCIRLYEGKRAEYFTIVIGNTAETNWWQKSHPDRGNIVIIDEEGLDKVLAGEEPEHKPYLLNNFYYRF